jgi:hypothetical protein
MKKTQTNTIFMGCAGIMRGVGVLCLMGVSISAHALTWEKSSVDLSLNAGSADVVVEFPFKNEGAGTVTIKEIKASCGCTRAVADSESIPPGGKGVVKATYVVGDRTGRQSVQVIVTTSGGGSVLNLLRLNLNILPVVSLTPRLVHWTKADGPIPRTIQIKQVGTVAVIKVEMGSIGEGFTADLKPGAEPGCWELSLTPKSVDQPMTAKAEVRVTVGEKTTPYLVYALVR